MLQTFGRRINGSLAMASQRALSTGDLLAKGEALTALKKRALELPSLTLTPKQLCDVELILNGAFAPLEGFMTQEAYNRVLDSSRLPTGALWPLPVTLDVARAAAAKLPNLSAGHSLALRDAEGDLIAVLEIQDVYEPNKVDEAAKVFGPGVSAQHPGVALLHQGGDVYVGGRLVGAQYPVHYDFKKHRHTPSQIKSLLHATGATNVIAYQTRSPIHADQLAFLNRATTDLNAPLLIQSVAGIAAPGDLDHYTRTKAILTTLPGFKSAPTLNMLPLAMRAAGKREALLHALIQKNYGATHIVMGPNHAESYLTVDADNYDAQKYVQSLESEIGIKVYPVEKNPGSLNDMQIRRLIQSNQPVPASASFPDVLALLKVKNPPPANQGFTLFFTGLSGSGKSTVANAVIEAIREVTNRPITLLDGDVVRTNLSSELGFSREHRDINIRRLGYVSSEITKNGGISVCAPIAPYSKTRGEVRRMIEPLGGFVEIWISTPLSTCEARDRKGLYAKARKGLLKGMTGIDDPYEAPETPELNIDTTDVSIEEAVRIVTEYLQQKGFIPKN